MLAGFCEVKKNPKIKSVHTPKLIQYFVEARFDFITPVCQRGT